LETKLKSQSKIYRNILAFGLNQHTSPHKAPRTHTPNVMLPHHHNRLLQF